MRYFVSYDSYVEETTVFTSDYFDSREQAESFIKNHSGNDSITPNENGVYVSENGFYTIVSEKPLDFQEKQQ
jgi:hypothetical protein